MHFSGSSARTPGLTRLQIAVEQIKKKLDKLPAGESVVGAFKAAATQSSICPSRRNGGSLGAFKPHQMVPAFDRYCFDPESKVGEVSKPIETQFGWHLILLEERTTEDGKVEKIGQDEGEESKKDS